MPAVPVSRSWILAAAAFACGTSDRAPDVALQCAWSDDTMRSYTCAPALDADGRPPLDQGQAGDLADDRRVECRYDAERGLCTCDARCARVEGVEGPTCSCPPVSVEDERPASPAIVEACTSERDGQCCMSSLGVCTCGGDAVGCPASYAGVDYTPVERCDPFPLTMPGEMLGEGVAVARCEDAFTQPEPIGEDAGEEMCEYKQPGTKFAPCEVDEDCYSGWCKQSCTPGPCCQTPVNGSGQGVRCQSDADCEAIVPAEELERGLEATCSKSDIYDGCNVTCMGMG